MSHGQHITYFSIFIYYMQKIKLALEITLVLIPNLIFKIFKPTNKILNQRYLWIQYLWINCLNIKNNNTTIRCLEIEKEKYSIN